MPQQRLMNWLTQFRLLNKVFWSPVKETVQKSSLGYADGKLNPLNPPYQGDFPLNSPLIRGARGVKNDERWVSCTVSKSGLQSAAKETVQESTAECVTCGKPCGFGCFTRFLLACGMAGRNDWYGFFRCSQMPVNLIGVSIMA